MEITIQQILTARENRAALQTKLLKEYGKPLICFTMNIAGPIKDSPLIREGFFMGQRMLQAQLARLKVIHQQQLLLPTGCEAYYVVDAEPSSVKQLTAAIEDSLPVARLFDMDVLDTNGQKLSRESLGLTCRKCLLCDNPVYICSSRRAHTVEQLQQETNRLLREALYQQDSRRIGALAAQSLLYEVCTTPKPGLVDRENNGSHKDMDIFTFMASTAVLQPYFTDCALLGMQTADLPGPESFSRLRLPGKLAELDMLAATDGVNTHKGAIFSLGVLCGAAGRLPADNRTPAAICAECKTMLHGLTEKELRPITADSAQTKGETLYTRHGITGIRGQAENGFPAVLQTGLPVFTRGLQNGLSLNDAGCAALLHLFCADTDTTLIARSDLNTLQEEKRRMQALLAQTPYPVSDTIRQLDADWTMRNLSAGGSADLLAITYFLYLLTN